MHLVKSKINKLNIIILVLIVMAIFSGCSLSNTTKKTDEKQLVTQPEPNKEETVEVTQNSTAIDLMPFYEEVKNLEGQAALAFFESLSSKGLSDNDILEFFINLPLSDANKDIVALYERDNFESYMSSYPSGEAHEGFNWTKGSGTHITGSFSELELKLPFTDYVKLAEGPVGDPQRTYRIGVAIHGFDQPWNVGLADSAQWEADRHSNIEIDVKDAQWDNDRMADIIDSFVLQKVDGILTWPMVESETTIMPVQRAIEANIPVVSVDRMTGFEETTSRVTGNFPANGAQSGMYLVWKLAQEGNLKANVVLLRKPLGSTADANRTGHFLKVLSYFPEINILKTYHDSDNTAEAFANMQLALTEFTEIDVVFGTGDHQAIAAYDAAKNGDRLNSRQNGKKMIFLSIDDSKTAITSVKNGEFELNTPYTPFVADIGVRALVNIILDSHSIPHNIITPNIPMVTQNGDTIFGLKTQTPDQWFDYTFGPPVQ
ncbi:sugar ABC transporter substrate-binding protein [Sporosarcina sp. FSL K6-3457]|uniref:sugar ABC transporter substrate-binding protein n=1 Tax=Sporosarcina sp. FSL K6-3457 TaxID=2978204 RepID=UPI0030FC5EA8